MPYAARIVILVSAGLLGCVGDDSSSVHDSGPDVDLTGTLGHPCFPDNGCLDGLTCQLPAGLCENLGGDAGMDASSSDGSNDASQESGMDAPFDSGCGTNPPFADMLKPCVGTGDVACVDPTSAMMTCTTLSACPTSDVVIECGSKGDCSGTASCCIDPSQISLGTTTCPILASITSSAIIPVSCSTSCAPTNTLCATDSECTGGTHCMWTYFEEGTQKIMTTSGPLMGGICQ